ncbi:antitoxin VbhA family protein [Aeromicrobium sp. Sec7.5]|uniref:antitoxin VbhA family protein n=1 Tax=Aeromicrobium sp. Sec7.5 TaxID=3121276 RepID=UPI002FE4DE4E
MARTIASKRVGRTPEEHVAHADAALAAAGHQVTDPTTRAIAARVARGEITGDEAVAQIRRHVQG